MRRIFPLILLALVGCEGGATHPDSAVELRANPVTDVVAVVGDRKVGASEFAFFWRKHPELSRQEAVEAIVDREVLVDYALGLTIHGDPRERVFSRKQGLIRALLRREIEKPDDPAEPEARDKVRKERLDALIARLRARAEIERDENIIVEEFKTE